MDFEKRKKYAQHKLIKPPESMFTWDYQFSQKKLSPWIG